MLFYYASPTPYMGPPSINEMDTICVSLPKVAKESKEGGVITGHNGWNLPQKVTISMCFQAVFTLAKFLAKTSTITYAL